MRKLRIIFSLIILLVTLQTRAAYLENMPVSVNQPNGQVLKCFASGDEYYNWLHDANGFTIIQDHKSGWYVYAELKNGELAATKLIPGKDDPAKAGLTAYTNISPEKMLAFRNKIVSETPPTPVNRDLKRNGPVNAVNTGTMNNIVIFIRFKGESEFTDLTSFYDNLFNAGTGNSSLKNYYEEMSYNKLHINTSFYPLPPGTTVISYQDTGTRNYFQPYDSATNPLGYTGSQRNSREFDLLKRAVDSVGSQVPASLDVDYNNDGNVDNVVFIVSGSTTAWSTLLWPHRWSLYGASASINGKKVWDFNLQLRDFMQNSGAGVLCHEMFHSLGAPDLYHYASRPVTPVGRWDIMASTANPPQAMGAFMKFKYGHWYDTIPEIKTCGRYSLNPVTSATNIAYKIPSPNSTTEFFIVEYRVKQGLFENSIPGTGLLIYKINTAASGNANGPPDEIYIYRPNGDTNHNGLVDSAFFGKDYNKTRFNYTTNPKCFLNNMADGGIDISNISQTGSGIAFTLNFKNVKPSADFTASTTNTCSGKVITLNEFSACFADTWLWNITPNTFQFVNSTTASSPNPQVKFNADGQYTVSLQVSNTNGSNTKTITNYITIGSGINLPYSEDFESASLQTNFWEVNNPDTAINWALTTKAKGNGSSKNSVYLNFFYNTVKGEKYDLISRNISLANKNVAALKFKVSYRRYNSTSKDSLKIFISTNCGVSYDTLPVYSKGGDLLRTTANGTAEFWPYSTNDWRTDSVNLNNYSGKSILIKFQGINDHGNNLFLDDINIDAYKTPVAGFTVSDTQICEKQSVTFSDTSTGDISLKTWTFPGGTPFTSNLDNPVVNYDTAGTYNVKLTITYRSINSIKEIQNLITVDSYPGKPLISWDYNSYLLTSGSNVFNQWYDGNGQISGATSKTYKPLKTGFYYVILDNHGCISESSDTLSINTGIAGMEKNVKLNIYPNPNNGRFSIHFDAIQGKLTETSIFNYQGQLIYHQKLTSNISDLSIDLHNQPAGIYLLKTKTDKNIYLTKFTISK